MEYRTLSSLVKRVGRSGIHELNIVLPTGRIRVKNPHKMGLSSPAVTEVLPLTKAVMPPPLITITSAQVGIFQYRKPGESARPLYAGCPLQDGDIVGYIYAMRSYTPVTVGCRAVIDRVHIEEGQAVEYGQCLFSLKTTSAIDSDG